MSSKYQFPVCRHMQLMFFKHSCYYSVTWCWTNICYTRKFTCESLGRIYDSHPINITPVKNNNKPRKALIVERVQSLKKDGNNNQKTTPLIFEMHLRGHSVYKKENWLTSNEEKVVFLKILYEDICTSHTDCLLIIDHVFTFIF